MKDLSKYSEIIIWGAAFSPKEIGRESKSLGHASEFLYSLLKSNGYKDKIIFFVDSNEKLQGKYRLGIEVKKPEEILKHPSALVIINATYSMQAIQNSMAQMGIHNDCLIIPYYYYFGCSSLGGGVQQKNCRRVCVKV